MLEVKRAARSRRKPLRAPARKISPMLVILLPRSRPHPSAVFALAERRGVGAVFEGFGIATAGHVTVDILQEFFLNRLTKRGKGK